MTAPLSREGSRPLASRVPAKIFNARKTVNSMLAVLAVAAAGELPARTAIVFGGDIVSLSTPAGPRLVYGAYYPRPDSPSLLPAPTSAPNATLAFPDYCSGIGISNQPAYDFELPLSSGIPEYPFVNICIWLHSQPANVSYHFYGQTNNTLQVEQIDGVDIPPILLRHGDRFQIQHDVLLRWLILSPEEASFFLPSLRIDPSADAPREKTFSTVFVVTNETVYFDPPPVTDTPYPTETPYATEIPPATATPNATEIPRSPAPSRVPPTTARADGGPGGNLLTIGAISLAGVFVVALGIVGYCCYRSYMARKGNRPKRGEAIPDEDTGDQGSPRLVP
jgi:hypothetical protein